MYLSMTHYHQLYIRVLNRALTRARAIELDFTNGGDEEETMCPVCHESKSLHLSRQAFSRPSQPSLRKQWQESEMRTRSVRR